MEHLMGKCVALEAVSGAGKTTLMGDLIRYYQSAGLAVNRMSFPTSNIDVYMKESLSKVEAYARDRRNAVAGFNGVWPKDKLTLIDRYTVSGAVYHCAGVDSLYKESCIKHRELSEAVIQPDLYIMLLYNDRGSMRVKTEHIEKEAFLWNINLDYQLYHSRTQMDIGFKGIYIDGLSSYDVMNYALKLIDEFFKIK